MECAIFIKQAWDSYFLIVPWKIPQFRCCHLESFTNYRSLRVKRMRDTYTGMLLKMKLTEKRKKMIEEICNALFLTENQVNEINAISGK